MKAPSSHYLTIRLIYCFISTGIEVYYAVLYICRCMWYLNSAMNPILYNLMSSKFRDGFIKLLGCKPLMRTTSWSDGSTRKGTFHTTSTNLSSSNPGNVVNTAEAQRFRHATGSVVRSVECASLNAIKYAKIVIEEKIEPQEMIANSNCESEVNNECDKCFEKGPDVESVSDPYPNKQQCNYNFEKSVNLCNADKCLSEENCDDAEGVTGSEKDLCINIYNLLSAKESLV